MKKRFLTLIFTLTATLTCLFGLSACGEEEHTITDVGTKLQSGISFNTLSVEGTNVYGKVSNATTEFSFIDEVTVKDNATYIVDNDKDCGSPIDSKTVDLAIGNNVFYVLETIGNDVKLFTVTIRRRPMHEVTFNTDGGTAVEKQIIEEDGFASQPSVSPTRTGYTFMGWDYDFSAPITEVKTITAQWTPTIYTITYELDGGTNHEDNPDTFTILTSPLTLNKPSRIGYIFGGWYVDAEYQQSVQTLTECKPYTVYARWIEGSEGLKYTLSNNEYTVSGYEGTDTQVVIPAVYDGHPVTSIGKGAFAYRSSLTSIVIPDSVTSIGDDAFEYCSGLTEIVIPESVTSIGDDAFDNCQSLTEIVIPDGVTSIGDDAFLDCRSLTEIVIPDSVTSIGDRAFVYCSSLTEIVIPDSVTSIDCYAFYGCSSLTEIVIPDSVTSIGEGAFSECSSLTIYCEAESQPSGWDSSWIFFSCSVYWYRETQPTVTGNYWHYDESGEIVVW